MIIKEARKFKVWLSFILFILVIPLILFASFILYHNQRSQVHVALQQRVFTFPSLAKQLKTVTYRLITYNANRYKNDKNYHLTYMNHQGLNNLKLSVANRLKNTKFYRSQLSSNVNWIQKNADVVIYGGGLSGVTSAIQLAKLGRKVILVEPTHLLGGQATVSGVSQFDMLVLLRKYGLIPQIIDAIDIEYGGSKAFKVGCHWDKRTDKTYAKFCPDVSHVNSGLKRLLTQSIFSNNIEILFNTIPISLTENINNGIVDVTGIKVYSWKANKYYVIHSNIIIDASEYGDLIPILGVQFYAGYPDKPYTSLEEVSSSNACIDDITYTAFIRDKRASHKLSTIYTSKIPRPEGYSLQDDIYFVSKVVPFGQSHQDGVSFKDSFQGNDHRPPWSFTLWSRYRPVPDSYVKIPDVEHPTYVGLNYANDYPLHGSLSVRYLSDPTFRHQVDCNAKLITYKMLYYFTNVYKIKKIGSTYEEILKPSSIPWYLSKEDPFCTENGCYSLQVNNCENIPDSVEKYLPPLPYVREGFRIYGRSTNHGLNNKADLIEGLLRWKDVDRSGNTYLSYGQRWHIAKYNIKSSVSVADYNFDHHGCYGPDRPQTQSGIFQIPVGSFIPAKVKGFLVAEKGLAVDHYVEGAIRVHESTILNGQVVGIIADKLINSGLDPQRLNIAKLQESIVNNRLKISRLTFKDVSVDTNYNAWKYAELMSTWDIFHGNNGYFKPYTRINRATFSVILYNLTKSLGHPLKLPSKNYFKDIPNNAWYRKYANALLSYRISNGCYFNKAKNIRKYCPSQGIKNKQAIVFLYKLGLILNYNHNPINCQVVKLPKDTPTSLRSFFSKILQSGMFTVSREGNTCSFEVFKELGCSDKLCMNKQLNRLDVAKLVWDFIKNTNYLQLSQ